MQNTNKKKICIVVSSLGGGGAERSSALLSQLLSNAGHEVHIISILNHIEYEYGGTLFNLGVLKDLDDSKWGRLKRFFKFRAYVKKNNFDVVIDNRTRYPVGRELFISILIYPLSKTIFVVRSYKLDKYFPKHRFITQQLYKRAARIVGVSKEIVAAVETSYSLYNTSCIYNPKPDFVEDEFAIDELGTYVLAYGRLKDSVKNFSLLIDAYLSSELKSKNIKLLILGNGEDETMLKDKVKVLKLTQYVEFRPFVSNPYNYIKKALYVCLTSRFEGFPRVLIEALSVGTPVISVNCKSGPKEIIIHEKNGLLVEEYTAEAFAKAMNSFIFDENLYKLCKQNAQGSIEHLTLKSIAEEWERLIDTI